MNKPKRRELRDITEQYEDFDYYYDADDMDAWVSDVIDQALDLRDAVDELLDGPQGVALLKKTAWMLEEPA